MKYTKKSSKKEFLIDILYDIVGCFIYGVGVQSLSAPYNLPPGGVTGISMIINHLVGLPISVLTLVFNIPLLIISAIKLGKRFTFSSLKTVAIMSVMLEICGRFIPAYHGDVMLASLFAGVLQGLGLGIIFLRGSTTGGTDILSKLLQLKYPHISLGKFVLGIDACVLVAAAFVYKSVATPMYSLILVFTASKAIDSIVYGLDTGRTLMIISDKQQQIYTGIHNDMNRGSTLLKGTGTYTGEPRDVLLCAVSTPEFHKIKTLIYSIDPNAFIMTVETDEVLGEGFKPLNF